MHTYTTHSGEEICRQAVDLGMHMLGTIQQPHAQLSLGKGHAVTVAARMPISAAALGLLASALRDTLAGVVLIAESEFAFAVRRSTTDPPTYACTQDAGITWISHDLGNNCVLHDDEVATLKLGLLGVTEDKLAAACDRLATCAV